MNWPSAHAEAAFRELFPQYPHAGPHYALDVLVDAVRAYREQDARLRAMLETAMRQQPTALADDWTRGT